MSAPLNATNIAVMKHFHWRTVMVGAEFLHLKCWKKCFLREVAPCSMFYGHLKAFFATASRGATLRSGYLASRYAVLEAARFLPRAVTIVRDTSATSSSQSLMIQSVCIIGNPSEAGNQLVLVSSRFIDASMYRDTCHAICIAILLQHSCVFYLNVSQT